MDNNLKSKNYGDLLKELVKADIKIRYSGSVLGFLWVFLKPFLTFLVIILVFSFFFQGQDSHYRFNVLFGLIFFTYFSEGTSRGLSALFDKSNLILKTRFPRELAVVVPLLHSFVNFLIMIAVSFAVWFMFREEGIVLSASGILIFLLALLIMTAIILAFSFFASILAVRFRDLSSVWGVVLQLLMYFTPIIYPLSVLPGNLQRVFILNPLTIIIDYSRMAFLGVAGNVPTAYFFWLGMLSLALLAVSYLYFKKYAHTVVELI